MKMQKIGGWALIAMLSMTVILSLIIVPITRQYGLGNLAARLDPAKVMAAYTGSKALFQTLTLFYLLTSIFYPLIALGVQERMQAKAPNLMRLMVIAASISATFWLASAMITNSGLASIVKAPDVSVYRPLLAIQYSLNMAGVHACSWAILLAGLGALSTGLLPRLLGYFILVCGILGVIEFMLPTVTAPVVISGTGLALEVISMIWLAVILIKKPEPA
jgi:hypothetical protein